MEAINYQIIDDIDGAIYVWKEALRYCNQYYHFQGKITPYKMLHLLYLK